MREEELREIEAIAKASTPGDLKWGMESFESLDALLAKVRETFARAESLELHSVFRSDSDMSVFVALTGNGPTSSANARFIAGARGAVLALVFEIRQLLELAGMLERSRDVWRERALFCAGLTAEVKASLAAEVKAIEAQIAKLEARDA